MYNEDRKQGRYPTTKRKVEDMWESVGSSKRAATKDKKEKELRETSLCDKSILWKMYHLHGFDISKDLVYDVMHVL